MSNHKNLRRMYAYNKALVAYETNPNPAAGDRLLVKAEAMFLTTLELCSDYHSNVPYFLGVINYTQKDNHLQFRRQG